jgi:hypothetical protein
MTVAVPISMHGLCGNAEIIHLILPLHILLVYQLEISLMDEGSQNLIQQVSLIRSLPETRVL